YLARDLFRPDPDEPPPAAERRPPAALVPGPEPTVRLPPEAVGRLGLTTCEVRAAPPPPPLQLPGTLLLDANHLARVRSRFAGEVVEVGPPGGAVRLGGKVKKEQLLAVVWSKDLGEKKSELADALSRLRLDEETA